MKTDLLGREYASVNDVKVGDKLECDGDFTCIDKGNVKVVKQDKQGSLFIECNKGEHHLCGQINDDVYIGLYKLGK